MAQIMVPIFSEIQKDDLLVEIKKTEQKIMAAQAVIAAAPAQKQAILQKYL